ncbi:serine protease [Mycobacterium triplex]|uniref:Serine protease n=1 Tax=Mycobacterium triplex TaxID=47839 RepID=A0A024JR84_9MYCO|nr:S1C family serine protease [Mycobacterium triplex]ORX06337.1 serine protease [Mycobacterium triplex]CDO86355.1 trypsin [Mycobacterium triplex]
MSKGHPRSVWWSWSVSVLAVVGLGLGLTTVPAAATTPGPSTPAQDRFRDAPMFPLDPGAIAAQVGPQIVNISTRFGYNNAIGAGTGIVIDPGGVVLTNNHVISAATDISAFDVGNGQTYAVDVIGYSRSADIAVLQLRGAGGLPAAAIGGGVAVGEPVVALGNTHGQGGAPSVVPGKVVALNQTVSATDTLTGADETLGGLIQADTAIKPGDSGGPLVNNAGQVVGVDTAATDSYKMSGGQGFAIPIGRAMGVANQIRSGAGSNSVHIGPTAFIGMGVAENGGNGARVQRLVDGGPAAGSGIAPGDVIVAVDNVPINGPTAMTDVLVPHHPGDVITLHWRAAAGGDRSAPVTLGDGPPA